MLKQINRKEAQHARTFDVNSDILPLPRPACSIGVFTLAVAQAGRLCGSRQVLGTSKLPLMMLIRNYYANLQDKKRITADSFVRVNICEAKCHVQRRIKRHKLDFHAERAVGTGRLPRCNL